TVERKRTRLKLRNADTAVGTGETRGIERLVSIDDGYQYQAAAEFHGEPDREFQAMFDSQVHQLAIDAGAGEAVLDQLLHFFFEFAFAAPNDGSHDHDTIIGRELHDTLHDLLGRLSGDGLAAVRAMRYADRGVEQTHVIVNLGDGSDGRAWTAAGGFLLDGDRRTQAVDRI